MQHTDGNNDLAIRYTDLAGARLGGRVLYATDDFFAEKENLIKPGRGIFVPDKYTERGKWMDGWESRRKRDSGHDWCVIRLATEGRIRAFDIDTNHFLGNHPPYASVEGLYHLGTLPEDQIVSSELRWREILQKSPLKPGSQNIYGCEDDGIYTHLRLHIYPDGGVARFRAYGDVHKDWSLVHPETKVDLASALNGARAMECSDMFFSAMQNLLMPGDGINMGDGWETKRSREENHRDWLLLKLACPGMIEEIVVDTKHFKGNYPDSCKLEGCFVGSDEEPTDDHLTWVTLLDPQKLEADTKHSFKSASAKTVSHVRFTIFPDGGVSRLRLFGTTVPV